MTTKVPCQSPEFCGVKDHIEGTAAARLCAARAGHMARSGGKLDLPSPVNAANVTLTEEERSIIAESIKSKRSAKNGYVPQTAYFKQLEEDIVRVWKKTPDATVLLISRPGMGKTSFIEALAKKHDQPLCVLLGNTMDPTDITGLPYPETNELGVTRTRYGLPARFEDLIMERRGIVFADEFLTASGATQSAMLSLLLGGHINDEYRLDRDNTWKIAATNHPKDSPEATEMSAAMSNRLIFMDWDPPLDDWITGTLDAWGKEEIEEEEAEASARICAFLKSNPQLFKPMPDQPGGQNLDDTLTPYCSPRSWTFAMKQIEGLVNTGEDGDKNTIYRVLRQTVGEQAASQYVRWEYSLSLPTYDEMIEDPDSINWKDLGDSEVFAVTGILVGNQTDENFDETAYALRRLVEESPRKDVCAAAMPSFLRKVPKGAMSGAGAKRTKESMKALVEAFGPILKQVLN